MPAASYSARQQRQDAVEEHLALHEAREAQPEVLDHAAAEVAAGGAAALVAEHVGHERVHVARVRREVVEAVRGQPGVAEAAQIRDDHLEAGTRQRRDVAPPDPLGLRPSVDEQQRVPALPRAHVGDAHAGAHLGVLDRKGLWARRVLHPGARYRSRRPAPAGDCPLARAARGGRSPTRARGSAARPGRARSRRRRAGRPAGRGGR